MGDLDAVRDLRLLAGLRLCRDRGPVSQQIRRRVGLWRGGMGALLQDHRAAFGLVQLAGMDAGSGHRGRAGGGVYPDDAVRRGVGDQCVGNHAGKPRFPQSGPDAADQHHLDRRDGDPADRVRVAASRYLARGQDPDRCRAGGSDPAADCRAGAAVVGQCAGREPDADHPHLGRVGYRGHDAVSGRSVIPANSRIPSAIRSARSSLPVSFAW